MKRYLPLLLLLVGCDVVTLDDNGKVVDKKEFHMANLPVSMTAANEVRYTVNDGRVHITEFRPAHTGMICIMAEEYNGPSGVGLALSCH